MNADWVMVVITGLYVVATIAICYYNKKAADAANKQAEVAQKQMQEMICQYNESNRPFVTIRFDMIRSGLMCFIVSNEGNITAKNVIIKINQEFLENIGNKRDREWLEAINTTDLFIASKQQIVYCFGGAPQFNDIAKVKAIFDIKYNDRFEEHIEIDIAQYGYTMIYNSSLEDISQHLKHLQEENKKFHAKIEKFIDKPLCLSDVLVHSAGENDVNKRRIYKLICQQPKLTSGQIASILDLEEEYVLENILELEKIDKLVAYTINEYNDREYSKLLWRKK